MALVMALQGSLAMHPEVWEGEQPRDTFNVFEWQACDIVIL